VGKAAGAAVEERELEAAPIGAQPDILAAVWGLVTAQDELLQARIGFTTESTVGQRRLNHKATKITNS
jgi:hypothetical protein